MVWVMYSCASFAGGCECNRGRGRNMRYPSFSFDTGGLGITMNMKFWWTILGDFIKSLSKPVTLRLQTLFWIICVTAMLFYFLHLKANYFFYMFNSVLFAVSFIWLIILIINPLRSFLFLFSVIEIFNFWCFINLKIMCLIIKYCYCTKSYNFWKTPYPWIYELFKVNYHISFILIFATIQQLQHIYTLLAHYILSFPCTYFNFCNI